MSMSVISAIDGESCGNESILGFYGLPIWIFVVIALTVAQFVLCEEYFVPVLTALGDRLRMSENVQGATLLAIGTSAPELYTAVIGILFYPKENPGPGTNVGSAVFNMAIIIGVCAIVSPQAHHTRIESFPFLRDSVCYFVSLLLIYLFYGVISPYVMELWESVVLLSWWIIYVNIIFHTRHITMDGDAIKHEANIQNVIELEAVELEEADSNSNMDETDEFIDRPARAIILHDMEENKELIGVQFGPQGKPLNMDELNTNNPNNIHVVGGRKEDDDGCALLDYDELDDNLQDLLLDLDANQRQNVNKGYVVVAKPSEGHERAASSLLSKVKSLFEASKSGLIYVRRKTALETVEGEAKQNCLSYAVKLLCCGWAAAFYYILPHTDGVFATKHAYCTIFMINIDLAILTFFLVDAAVKIGHCIGMPLDLIGITFLAIGSSISDCIASVLVARQNKMDMAVATAFSSNIFDINLCIGLSFLLGSCLNYGNGMSLVTDEMDSFDRDLFSWLIFAAIMLLFALWAMMLCTKLKLTKWIGYVLVAAYAAFIALFCTLYLE